MTKKPTKTRVVRYDSLDDMPSPKPLPGRVKAMAEEEARAAAAADPDAGEIPPGFWREAKVIMPSDKVSIGIRLDRDVVEWFKTTGKGYQTRINAVLKSYMNAHKGAE